jgi:AraC-like DNA-binding protein
MSPGQAHKLELSQDIEGFIFIFNADFYLLNRSDQNSLIEFPFFYTVQQDNPPLRLDNQEDVSFIEKLFIQGIAELKKTEYSIEMMRSLLDLILTTCASRYKASDNGKTKGKGHILVKRFYQLVEENYQKNLSLGDYAALLAVTPNHLTQTVRQLTGKTSSQIIVQKQILEIKRLLIHTSLNISQIASQLNFEDQSYFSKFFKRETKLSPLEFRAKAINPEVKSIS